MLTADAVEPYVKGLQVWIPDPKEGWRLATVESRTLDDKELVLELRLENSAEDEPNVVKKYPLAKTDSTELPPLRNPPNLDGIDDLTNLSYLHEPAVLNNVRIRYMQHNIYTYSGIVLIAMNPFHRVQLYSPELMLTYSGKRRGELEPHLFAIAEEAYRDMIQEKRNETIVVSGESGAGKTVSAKYIMRYFATVDASGGKKVLESRKDDRGSEIEEKIMATNPILESFGNAKTTRNDNSSRFGKYIQIHFDKKATIVGASIRTYLLERSRLIFQPATERNYHIFYQLCAGAPPSERAALSLDDCMTFHYLNQGNCSHIQGVDDAADFVETQRALSTIGMSVQRQWDIFRVLAGLLHLGNVTINSVSKVHSSIAEDDKALITASELLGVDKEMLTRWIVNKQITTRSEKITTKLTVAQAMGVRDSISKFIYSSLFDWLVDSINATLCNEESRKLCHTFIGVLDIYGFEHFEHNSFEQFCINYANEKLQQHFNQHVFKLEQEEYIREQIDWQFIEFSDNQPCINIIEGKLGVLALLDEESRMPSGTDENFATKLIQQLDKPENAKYFKKPRFQRNAFTICHYAHDVTYSAEGFLEKNRDNVPDEIKEVLESSSFEFLVEVQAHRIALNQSQAVTSTVSRGRNSLAATKKPTLGSVFKGSLIELMSTINATEVHYIRCIKPNEGKVAWKFEANMTLSQLRACGVLETIHISSKGYPSRRTLPEFVNRYYMLVHSSERNKEINELTKAILEKTLGPPGKYQIGLTKVFFRAGQLALLEKARTQRLTEAATLIKKNLLARVKRKEYLRLRRAAITIQVKYRYKLKLRERERARREAASVTIQRYWRGYYQRTKYQRLRKVIIGVQALARGKMARETFTEHRQRRAAINIQRLARGWLARSKHQKEVRLVIFMQSCIRRRLARRELVKLRTEARSANHYKEVSYKLENKVIALTQDLQTQRKANEALKETVNLLENRLKAWKEKCKSLEHKNRELAEKIINNAKEQREALQFLIEEKESFAERCASLTEKIAIMDQDAKKLSDELLAKQEEVNKLREELARQQARLQRRDSRQSTRRGSAMDIRNIFSPKTAVAPSGASPTIQEEMEVARPVPQNNRYSVASVWSMTQEARLKRATLSAYDTPNGSLTRATSKRISVLMAPANPEQLSNEDLVAILGSDLLMSEIVNDLIKNIAIPLPDMERRYASREILFPAHLIGLCIAQMWSFKLSEQLKKLLFNVAQSIQLMTAKFKGDYICVFWLSNIMELLSILAKTESKMALTEDAGGLEVVRVIGEVKADLRQLSLHILETWLADLRTRANKLAIPAVVESQSLPGFVSNDTGFFNKLMGQQQPAFNIDNMLTFLVKLWKTINFYYLDKELGKKVILDVLDTIGMISFNHLLMRKNFGTWKRGMQIQYNVTRIEEWCKSHDIQQSSDHLERLMQAAKLLQLQKNTIHDIDIMFEVCFLLTRAQIKKLITIYSTSDYENPISPEIMQEVIRRCDEHGDGEGKLFLEVQTNRSEDALHQVKPATTIDRYIPAWLDLPNLRRVVMADEDMHSPLSDLGSEQINGRRRHGSRSPSIASISSTPGTPRTPGTPLRTSITANGIEE